MLSHIRDSLNESIALKSKIVENNEEILKIEIVANLIIETLKNGNKLLLCGNGGSASDAQHIAAEFVGRFMHNREALAAIALTTDTSIITAVANDFGYSHIFERQINALGRKGDILIALSTSGNSENVELAIDAATKKGIKVIGFLGKDGGRCKELCQHSFIIESSSSARIQELHITIGHIICALVEDNLVNNNG
ncbi:MAG: D-sedoheptulose 7-phosphate isomerase [Rikenellaceae bacterium]